MLGDIKSVSLKERSVYVNACGVMSVCCVCVVSSVELYMCVACGCVVCAYVYVCGLCVLCVLVCSWWALCVCVICMWCV